jgi:hypothetical protein
MRSLRAALDNKVDEQESRALKTGGGPAEV